jgi:hypothetical protein
VLDRGWSIGRYDFLLDSISESGHSLHNWESLANIR